MTQDIAIHEAGHAVIGYRHGLSIAMTSIKPNPDSAGRVSGSGGAYNEDEAASHILTALAGFAAMVAFGLASDEARIGASSDYEGAAELLAFWFAGDNLADWERRALAEVEADRKAIKAVADALLAHETLSDFHLAVLIEHADGDMTDEEAARALRMETPA